MIKHARDALRELITDETFELALRDLDPEWANAYRTAVTGWVPIRIVDAVARTCGRAISRDAMALNDEVSRRCAERAYTTIWRAFFRFSSDEALLTRAPLLYSRTYNRGALDVRFPSSSRAVVEVLGWPDPPEIVARGLAMGIERVLALSGRDNPRIHIQRAAPIYYECTWSRV